MSEIELDDAEVLHAWPAFVDLLAATVLVFLVLIAVVVVRERQGDVKLWRSRVIAEIERTAGVGAFDLDSLSDPLAVGMSLRAAATFPSLRFEFDSLTPAARGALDQLSTVLRNDSVLKYAAEIRVLGFTDLRPYADAQSSFSNWELSAARASAVARYLVTVGGVDPCRVTATGRGSHFPIMKENRVMPDESRRIEVWILPTTRVNRSFLRASCDPRGDGTVPREQAVR